MAQPNDPRYAAALQDPEYLALLAQLDAALNNQMSEYDVQSTDTRAQFGKQLRNAGLQLPTDLKRSTEGAAGRGMLYSGGLLEEQGDIQKRFADYNAQIGDDQTSQLNQIERGRLGARNDYNAKRETGLQGAVQRALARAEKAAIATPANPPGTDTPVAGVPAGTPVPPPVGTPVPETPAPVAPVAAPVAAPVSVPQNAGQVYTPRPITQQDRDQANASTYAGPNNPTLAPSHTNPILRPGDSPTPNSPLYNTIAPGYDPGYNPNADNGVVPGAAPAPVAANAGGAKLQAPASTSFGAKPQAAPVQRDMSTFSAKDQTVLSLGGTVKLGGVIPAKYNPLTGKVEPI